MFNDFYNSGFSDQFDSFFDSNFSAMMDAAVGIMDSSEFTSLTRDIVLNDYQVTYDIGAKFVGEKFKEIQVDENVNQLLVDKEISKKHNLEQSILQDLSDAGKDNIDSYVQLTEDNDILEEIINLLDTGKEEDQLNNILVVCSKEEFNKRNNVKGIHVDYCAYDYDKDEEDLTIIHQNPHSDYYDYGDINFTSCLEKFDLIVVYPDVPVDTLCVLSDKVFLLDCLLVKLEGRSTKEIDQATSYEEEIEIYKGNYRVKEFKQSLKRISENDVSIDQLAYEKGYYENPRVSNTITREQRIDMENMKYLTVALSTLVASKKYYDSYEDCEDATITFSDSLKRYDLKNIFISFFCNGAMRYLSGILYPKIMPYKEKEQYHRQKGYLTSHYILDSDGSVVAVFKEPNLLPNGYKIEVKYVNKDKEADEILNKIGIVDVKMAGPYYRRLDFLKRLSVPVVYDYSLHSPFFLYSDSWYTFEEAFGYSSLAKRFFFVEAMDVFDQNFVVHQCKSLSIKVEDLKKVYFSNSSDSYDSNLLHLLINYIEERRGMGFDTRYSAIPSAFFLYDWNEPLLKSILGSCSGCPICMDLLDQCFISMVDNQNLWKESRDNLFGKGGLQFFCRN